MFAKKIIHQCDHNIIFHYLVYYFADFPCSESLLLHAPLGSLQLSHMHSSFWFNFSGCKHDRNESKGEKVPLQRAEQRGPPHHGPLG